MPSPKPKRVQPGAPRHVVFPDWSVFVPSPKQLTIYQDRSKSLLLNAGRGFGKDYILLMRMLTIAFELYMQRSADPRFQRRRPGPIVNVAVVAPVYSNAEGCWEKMTALLPEIPGLGRGKIPNIHIEERKHRIRIFGREQIVIQFISTRGKNNARSHGYDIMLITEAAYLSEHTFNSVLRPLCKRPGYAGYIMANSTPNNGWWDRAIDSAQKRSGRYARWDVYTGRTQDNPYCDDDLRQDLEDLKTTNPLRYQQEAEALLFIDAPQDDDALDDRDHAWQMDLLDQCLIADAPTLKGPFVVGIDLAFGGADDLCVTVLDASTNHVCCIEVINGADDPNVLKKLFRRLHVQWRNPLICYDANHWMGSRLAGFLRDLRVKPHRVGSQSSDNSKCDMVGHLTQHLLDRTITIPDPNTYNGFSDETQRANFRRLRTEFRTYRQSTRETADGRRYIHYGKSANGSDDVLDSLMYCLVHVPCRTRSQYNRPSIKSRLRRAA